MSRLPVVSSSIGVTPWLLEVRDKLAVVSSSIGVTPFLLEVREKLAVVSSSIGVTPRLLEVRDKLAIVSSSIGVTPDSPQWGAADAEIKVPSGENTELKRSRFKTWSRSVYSHKCYTYCQGFLPCLFLPFQSIHLHFFPKPHPISSVLAVANTWFLCGPRQRQVPVLSSCGILIG